MHCDLINNPSYTKCIACFNIREQYAITTGSKTSRSDRCKVLMQAYINRIAKKVMEYKLIVPQDIIDLLFNFYYIALHSLILDDNEAVNNFFNLLSQQITIKRLENAKLLYRASRDDHSDNTWFDKLAMKGPY